MKAYRVLSTLWVLSLLCAATAPGAFAQGAQPAKQTDEQLQLLVAPIALYPDSLIAHILPASTVPVDIVEAARYLREKGGKVEESPEVPWLPSVRALMRFPDVLYMMDEKLSWSRDLGQAVTAQQSDVMDAIQHVRKIAEESGALASNDKQVVKEEKEVIEIVPADPEVIYVPVYDPEVIYVQEPATVVVEDATDEAAAAVAFGVGVAVGAAFAEDDCDWYGHCIYHYGYYGWDDIDIDLEDAWVWRPGPGGLYDPRGVYDPRGLFDPRGRYDPRGPYDPRGAFDPRGPYDPRGAAGAGAVGAATARSAAGAARPTARPATVGTRPGGVGPAGTARSATGVSPPAARTAGAVYTGAPRATAAPNARGYTNPAVAQGSFGTVSQGAAVNRASARGASSISSAGRALPAPSGGMRAGGMGGGRGGRMGGRR